MHFGVNALILLTSLLHHMYIWTLFIRLFVDISASGFYPMPSAFFTLYASYA